MPPPSKQNISKSSGITKLAYQKINDKFSKAMYGDIDVIMDIDNGYINATKLCTDKGKNIKNWLGKARSKELIKSFKKTDPLYVNVTGDNDLRGTYIHPALIPTIVAWLYPLFDRRVAKIVNNFILNKEVKLTGDTSWLAGRTFGRAPHSPTGGSPDRRLHPTEGFMGDYYARYLGFDVIMNIDSGFINVTQLCIENSKNIKNWLGNDSSIELIRLFKDKHLTDPLHFNMTDSDDELRGFYAHPELIPTILAWCSPSHSRKIAIIVNNFLVNEITLQKSNLEKSIEKNEKRREEYKKYSEESEKMLLKMLKNKNTTLNLRSGATSGRAQPTNHIVDLHEHFITSKHFKRLTGSTYRHRLHIDISTNRCDCCGKFYEN